MVKFKKILEYFCSLVQGHHMLVNETRAEVIPFGNMDTEDKFYTTPEGNNIKWVLHAEDLCLWFDLTAGWKTHICKVWK